MQNKYYFVTECEWCCISYCQQVALIAYNWIVELENFAYDTERALYGECVNLFIGDQGSSTP